MESSILIAKILAKKLGHTAVKLESRHATGEQELTDSIIYFLPKQEGRRAIDFVKFAAIK